MAIFKNTGLMSILALLLIGGTGLGELIYDFDDGTLQGWITVSDNPDQQTFVVWPNAGAGHTQQGKPHEGTGHIAINIPYLWVDGYYWDSPHETMWLRSPEFKLTGGGDLTAWLYGGGGASLAGTLVADVPASSVGGGFRGVALRNADTDVFVLCATKTEDGDFWERVEIIAANLAHLDADAVYTLDFIDAGHGGWGWVNMDSVTIPGTTNISNTSPFINAVSDQVIARNTSTGAIGFTVDDDVTPANELIVTGSSSNTTLVPDANIVFGGSGTNRTVTVTPAADQTGTAVITLTASDGELSSSERFTLTVAGPMTFDFDNGTLQGWMVVSTDAQGRQYFAVVPPGVSSPQTSPQSGSHFAGLHIPAFDGVYTQDGEHDTLWLRSPEFKLIGGGGLTAWLSGGGGSSLAGTPVADVPAASVGGGFRGVALRNVDTEMFVLCGTKTQMGNAWQEITFTEAQLAQLDQDAVYTLDLIDAAHGSWGWVNMDSVTIPAVLAHPAPQPPDYTPQVTALADPWVATDALGRTLPTYEEVGPPRDDRYVGLFYWLWHRAIGTRTPSKNVTDLLAGSADPSNPDWGEDHFNWHWAEPEDGYYRSDDRWVLRKHLIMFANAGVDFLFLDYTNDEYYVQELAALCETALELMDEGIDVPKFVFFFNYRPLWKVEKAYNEIYKPGLYRDLWFYWKGKPLMLSPQVSNMPDNDTTLSEEILDFFTWRKTWAFNTQAHDWLFLDTYPQDASQIRFEDDRPEQVVASKAMGAPLYLRGQEEAKGSSAQNNQEAPLDEYWVSVETGKGHFFEEQWSRVHALDPAVVLVTGWNEWTAGTWPADQVMADHYDFMGKPLEIGDVFMVDGFNTEFNRDLEPMKGGYTDNFYYQLVSHIRRFKGMTPPTTASPPRTIAIDGDFEPWSEVYPVFRDAPTDAAHRNHPSLVNWGHHSYTNTTGRNDIIESRVTYDTQNVYIYVRTREPLTSHTGQYWMLVFIDADRTKDTGWQGYNYIVNLEVISDTLTTLWAWQDGDWSRIAEIDYRYAGEHLELAISRTLIGQQLEVDFYFKIADSINQADTIESFFINGDVAPDRRFNYHYRQPTCMDLLESQDDRYVNPYLVRDISGPDSIPDCRVDLYDFIELSEHWLQTQGSRAYVLSDLVAVAMDWLSSNDPLLID